MRIRHLAIGAIAVVGLTLSACAGGAGTGTQSASGAASGGGDSAASANSATSGAEDGGTDQSAAGTADSALSADSATSSASPAGGADTPASAPSAAGASQSGQTGVIHDGQTIDATTVLEVTHIPEGYEEAPTSSEGIGYKKGEESGFLVMAAEGDNLPANFTALDAFKQMPLEGVDPSAVKEGEKVSADGLEFHTAYTTAELDGKSAGTAVALAQRENKVVFVLFVSPGQGEEGSKVDPALVKSVLEGIKWKK